MKIVPVQQKVVDSFNYKNYQIVITQSGEKEAKMFCVTANEIAILFASNLEDITLDAIVEAIEHLNKPD
jgi:hypothetical protein